MCLPMYLSICVSIRRYPSICRSIYVSILLLASLNLVLDFNTYSLVYLLCTVCTALRTVL